MRAWKRISSTPCFVFLPALVALLVCPPAVGAQTRIMPLGDSITQGGQGYCAYRYELWFDLLQAGYDVAFVGGRNFTNDGSPNLAWYPNYLTTFDRDHEGYWGWRTDQIAGIITAAVASSQPDIILIHLGTNDIGQSGASGVASADTYLRQIIGAIRSVAPSTTLLLAQVIPIGPGTSYFANAAQVAPLNTVIADIAADSSSAASPIVLVDQNAGFDLGTMMQSDGLHPNLAGEARMSGIWQAALAPLLLPGNPRPSVSVTSPADGAEFVAPASTSLDADASDPNGFVASVAFFADTTLIGVDTSQPFSVSWSNVPPGVYSLSAIAQDDQGATSTSNIVTVSVLPFVGGTPVVVSNPSFEVPALSDGALAEGPGIVGGWTLQGTAGTFTGIFNPPAGSYPSAGGNGTPAGADGANACYLFNNGGPSESVSATQTLADTLRADTEYLLRVAIGTFLPNQPYAFSAYGGYRIELRAGSTVIASSEDETDPLAGTFRDAFASVSSASLAPALIGEVLSIRLEISAADAPRSTHFDNVRLTTRPLATAVDTPPRWSNASVRAFPNPFNPATVIEYTVPRAGEVRLSVFDARGRHVSDIVESAFVEAGVHRVDYRAALPSGVYFIRLETVAGNASRKLVVLK